MALLQIHRFIPSMHVRILVLMVVGKGLGFVMGVVHVHLCRSCRVFLMFLMMRMMLVWMELIR